MCHEKVKLIFVWVFFAIQTGVCGQACKPMIKENDSLTLNCTVSSGLQTLTWKLDGRGIVECNNANTCTYNTSQYTVQWSNSNGVQINHLTIHRVKRAERQFSCILNNIQVEDCLLCVTTKPSKPTCETPKFTGPNNNTLTITCETSSVYPDAICSLSHFNTSKSFVAVPRTEKSSSGNDLSDVSVKCIIPLQLDNVPPTDETFAVTFSPTCDLSEGVINRDLSVMSDFGPTIFLKLPVVSTLNCDFGDIPIGTSVTCKCELSELGNPPGSARWYSPTGRQVGQTDDRTSLLNLTLDTSNLDPEYHCKPSSILNTSQDTSHQVFKPKFAYGPYNLVTVSREFDLCSGNEAYITCSVPVGQVQPKPLYTIIYNSKELVSKQPGQNNGAFYDYKYDRLSFNTTGVIQYRCRAHNSISPENYTEQFGNLTIKGPPSTSPVLTVSNSDVLEDGQVKVKKDTNIEISCTVDGGYPKVSTVTIQCPTQTVTENGQYATLIITKVNESLHGLSCRCTATHDSIPTCYKHSSSKVTFTVTDEEPLPVLAIGLGAGGGFLFILIIIIGIIVCVKPKKARENQHTIPSLKEDYNSIRPNEGEIYEEIDDVYMTPEQDYNGYDNSTVSGTDNYSFDSFNTSPTYQSSDWTESNKPPLCHTNMNQQLNDYLHVL